MRDAVITADAVNSNDIALVLDGAGESEVLKMRHSRKRPCGRDNKGVDPRIESQFSIKLGESEIVTDAQSKAQMVTLKMDKIFTRRKAFGFIIRQHAKQMNLSIFRYDFSG